MTARVLILVLLLPAARAGAADAVSKRLSGLEKRVTSVEGRVTRLEKGSAGAPAAAKKPAEEKADPIAVVFVKKKQVVGEKVGLMLYLEFENVSRRRFYAFNGVLVFRDESGAVVWTRPYGYSETVSPGDKVDAALAVSSEQTREYLKLLKARTITVTLEKQEAYGAD